MYNIKRDLLFTLTVQVVIMLTGLFINKFLSSHLSVENFGLYNIIKRTATVFGFTFLCGMGIAMPKFLPSFNTLDHKRDLVTGSVIIIGLLMLLSLILILLFPISFSNLLFDREDRDLMYLTFVNSIGICLCSYLYAFYRALDLQRKFSTSQLIVQLGVLGITYLFSNNLRQYLFFVALFQIIYCMIFFTLQYFRSFNYIGIPNREAIRTLSKYGISRLIGDFILFGMSAMPVIILNHKFGLKESSYFSVSVTLNYIITPLFSYVGIILLPKVSASLRENNFGQMEILIRRFLILFLGISIAVVLTLHFFGEYFINIFFDKKYLSALKIVKIVSLSVIPYSIYLLLRNPIDALENRPFNTYNLMITGLLMVILLYFSKNIYWAAMGYTMAYVVLGVSTCWTWFVVKNKKLKIYKNEGKI